MHFTTSLNCRGLSNAHSTSPRSHYYCIFNFQPLGCPLEREREMNANINCNLILFIDCDLGQGEETSQFWVLQKIIRGNVEGLRHLPRPQLTPVQRPKEHPQCTQRKMIWELTRLDQNLWTAKGLFLKAVNTSMYFGLTPGAQGSDSELCWGSDWCYCM